VTFGTQGLHVDAFERFKSFVHIGTRQPVNSLRAYEITCTFVHLERTWLFKVKKTPQNLCTSSLGTPFLQSCCWYYCGDKILYQHGPYIQPSNNIVVTLYENCGMKCHLRYLLPSITCSCRAEAARCFWKNMYFFPVCFLESSVQLQHPKFRLASEIFFLTPASSFILISRNTGAFNPYPTNVENRVSS